MAEQSKPAPRGKRERLTQAAVDLAHRQGYRNTTLAHLAEAADVPLGNIYYYFKSKDDIGRAILDQRMGEIAQMQAALAELPTPLERLLGFVEATINNAPLVAERGCPLGSLSAEMAREDGDWTGPAKGLLGGPMAWMEKQFGQMGREEDAADLALQLQSSLQGASILAHSLGDPALLVREGRRLQKWLGALAADSPG
ncbi:TetR/AcrR family transcriptional regulator [Devosia sp. XK-2]|uniref:TetR/AcrR family transcriptional regulator n=1 Tax=Devosia sp. XK-2 TaxID=3126689 RepID=UPI0030D05380